MQERAQLRRSARRATSAQSLALRSRIVLDVTGVVDITPGRPVRLLEVLPGSSGKIYAEWLAEREQTWREQVSVTALIRYAVCTPL